MSANENEMSKELKKMISSSCEFILGITDLSQLPGNEMPEIAFAGRSNVGKSSLLNALTGRKALARVSHTPGRTQQLNFFEIGKKFILVDMPGYGYAKVSKKMRKEWDKLILEYLKGRPNLRTVFVLIDSRHGLKESDLHLFSLLDKAAVAYRIILTKIDKTSPGELNRCIEETEKTLKKHPAAFPSVLATSSHKKEGLEGLQEAVCVSALS